MDWAILIFLVVTGLTAGSLWWWCTSAVEKAVREGTPREVTPPDPRSTPRDISGNVLWAPRTR